MNWEIATNLLSPFDCAANNTNNKTTTDDVIIIDEKEFFILLVSSSLPFSLEEIFFVKLRLTSSPLLYTVMILCVPRAEK